MERPYDIADIVRLNRPALERVQPLSAVQGRALSAIVLYRTAALGGHAYFCPNCGYQEPPSYNSCRNRNCPKCQALAQEHWIAARAAAILPVPHFHGVFTLPADFRPLARQYPRPIFDTLLRCTAAALLEMAQSRLGVRAGAHPAPPYLDPGTARASPCPCPGDRRGLDSGRNLQADPQEGSSSCEAPGQVI